MQHRQFNQDDKTIVVIEVTLVKNFYEANKKLLQCPPPFNVPEQIIKWMIDFLS